MQLPMSPAPQPRPRPGAKPLTPQAVSPPTAAAGPSPLAYRLTANSLPIEYMIADLHLEPKIQASLRYRYVSLVREFRRRAGRLSLLFNASRIIATLGSIIISSLLSIQYTTVGAADPSRPEDLAQQNRLIFWITWSISFFVTASNGLLTLFKLDKKYFFVHTTLEQLVSEGWQYIQLTAKYSGFYTPGQDPTHENQYLYFCHSIEKIKMRQVEEEYYKLTEMHATVAGSAAEAKAAAVVAAAAAGVKQEDTMGPNVIISPQRAALPPSARRPPSPSPSSSPPSPRRPPISSPPLKEGLSRLPPDVAQYFPGVLEENGGSAASGTAASGRQSSSAGPENKETATTQDRPAP